MRHSILKEFVWIAGLAIVFGASSQAAAAQSTWTKVKLQVLQQACKGGDQNSCQQLAKLNQKLSQQGQSPNAQQEQRQSPQQPQPGEQSGMKPSLETTTGGGQAAAAWEPPADDAAAAPVKLDPAKMPDVVGIRLGMPAAEALAAMHRQYPADLYERLPVTWWPSAQKPDYGYTVLSSANQFETDGQISFTAPPGPQVVWHFTRSAFHMNINHGTLLAALRAKYGKETVAMTNSNYEVTTEDSRIAEIYWLYNELGERAAMPPTTAFPGRGTIDGCGTAAGNGGPVMPVDDVDDGPLPSIKGWCRTMVSLHVSITDQTIVQNTITEMVDMPLAFRTAHAAKVWQANLAAEQRKKAIDKSKTVTPTL